MTRAEGLNTMQYCNIGDTSDVIQRGDDKLVSPTCGWRLHFIQGLNKCNPSLQSKGTNHN